MPDSGDERTRVERVEIAHHRLADRVAATASAGPAAVLNLGAAVLFHAELEHRYLFEQHSLLDARLIEQMTTEHAQLAQDLELFESLWHADPDSQDLPALSTSLLKRLTDHVMRDERVLHDLPSRLSRARPDGDPDQ